MMPKAVLVTSLHVYVIVIYVCSYKLCYLAIHLTYSAHRLYSYHTAKSHSRWHASFRVYICEGTSASMLPEYSLNVT